jgi:prepilin-type N-terminal cleavage/methylation domain-containing protein
MIPIQKNMRAQAGFTLVELAIVMIIIGLLIAGVLKGQALIGNAKVTAQVAQVKSIDAATSTFKDMYATLPGDMGGGAAASLPQNRLPNCAAAPCNQAGNGDGGITQAPGVAVAGASEAGTYFVHLSAADLITGINPALGMVWGGQVPSGKINGGIDVGSSAGNLLLANGAEPAISTMGGLYLTLHLTPNTAAVAAEAVFTGNEAQRIDTKIDDGQAISGSVSAFGTLATCWLAAGNYAESIQGKNCGLYIRIQG